MSFSRRMGTWFSTSRSHRPPVFCRTAPPMIRRSWGFKLILRDMAYPASASSWDWPCRNASVHRAGQFLPGPGTRCHGLRPHRESKGLDPFRRWLPEQRASPGILPRRYLGPPKRLPARSNGTSIFGCRLTRKRNIRTADQWREAVSAGGLLSPGTGAQPLAVRRNGHLLDFTFQAIEAHEELHPFRIINRIGRIILNNPITDLLSFRHSADQPGS